MIKTNDDPNDHMAFPTWNPYWDQNIVNGEYVIAYTFCPSLDQAVKSGLPEVYYIPYIANFRTQKLLTLE